MSGMNLAGLDQLKNLYDRLTWQHKLMIVVFTVLVAGVIGVFVMLMNSVDMSVLYSGLSTEDSAAVVARLKEMKVPYRVSGDGQIIEVPADKISDIRLQLAGEGIPQSGRIGFEIFDKTNFGMTDFTQKINLRRALEGELGRTISHMKEVRNARVHITIPPERLFKDQQEKAKASVVVSLKSGNSLDKEQVQGITHLVASAVPGLTSDNVAVLDNAGDILTAPMDGPEDQALTKTQSEYRRAREVEYQTKIMSILEPIIGMDKVKANVSLMLDLNRVEQTSEIYDPDKSVVVQNTRSADITPGSSMVGGVAGTRSNLPTTTTTNGQQPAAPGSGQGGLITTAASGQKVSNQESTTYQLSRTVRKETFQVGSVKKLSIAVIVDNHNQVVKDKNGKPSVTSIAWSDSQLENFRNLVAAAVGFDPNRGDVLSIVNIPFQDGEVPTTALPEPGFLERNRDLIPMVLKYIGILLLFFLIYLLLVRPVKRRVVQALNVTVSTAGRVPLAAAAVHGSMGEAAPSAAVLEAPAYDGPSPEEIAMEHQLKQELQKSKNVKAIKLQELIEKEAKNNPEKLANTIRTWLVE